MTNDEYRAKLGQEIRRLRRAAGLNQEELANLAGLHRNSLGSYEAGKSIPSEVLFQLCRKLGTQPHIIIERILHGGQVHPRRERRTPA